MITKLSIQSFKAISSKTDISLKPFNVIIGRNGSGKSSAIEALSWLCDCIIGGAVKATQPFHRITDIIHAGDDTFKLFIEFDPRDLSIGNLVTYCLAVKNDNGRPAIDFEELIYTSGGEEGIRIATINESREYRLSLKSGISKRDRELLGKRAKGNKADESIESVLYALDNLEKQEFSSARNIDETLIKLIDPIADRGGHLLRETLEKTVFLRLNPRAIGHFSEAGQILSTRLLDEEGSELAALLGQLDIESLHILIDKVRFVTGRMNDCDVHTPAGPADRTYFEFTEEVNGQEYKIPAWMLSEGTRRITAILALLIHDDPPPLICIEEIENGLDPWTIQFILEELSSASLGNTQIIITTHSPYLLNQVPLENIILVENLNGSVTFTSGETLQNEEPIFNHMGAGDLYSNRYLHEKLNGGNQ